METWEIWLWIGGGVFFLLSCIGIYSRQQEEEALSRPSVYFELLLWNFSSLLIKSDRVKPIEYKLNFIESYLLPLFGPKQARKKTLEIRDEAKNNNLKMETSFKNNLVLEEKMILLDYLITLAESNGEITKNEMKTLRLIAEKGIGITKYYFDFDIFESEYFHIRYDFAESNSHSSENFHSEYNIENDYKMFEINSSATNEEVKKAYYDQMAKHHPDKVNHLGEHLKKFANDYCTELNEAYDRIKKERGMN
jgi:DnaJ like chaperone protein